MLTTVVASANAPLLSIVIPAFNVGPYIAAALHSALDQTYRGVEVIVVNDGSTDHTAQVIADVMALRSDSRLRVIHQRNGGLSAARNTGIAAAAGEFIGFLDADDVWHPTKAERHIRHLLADPTLGISYSHSQYIEEDGRPTGRIAATRKISPSLRDMIKANHVGNGSTPVVRRICFKQAGTFRTSLRSCEDYELWCRILWATELRAEAIPEPLTLYRLRSDSLSFAYRTFVANADMAVESLRAELPGVPGRYFRAGRAEHYRVAAWKAELTGQHREAVRLVMRSLQLCPWLILGDFKAGSTALALLMPPWLRQQLTVWYRSRRLRKWSGLDGRVG